jgi:hypothetical protein
MMLEAGKSYRAKTAQGEQISFLVTHTGDGAWLTVDLDSADGPEPGVWLNTRLLLWISTDLQRTMAVSRATEEVIEALEKSAEEA